MADNIPQPLRIGRAKRAEVRRRVADALTRVTLNGVAARYPPELGGGPQQLLQVFWRVYLPLSVPSVYVGSLFILGLGFSVSPALLGSRHETTIAMYIGDVSG